MHTAKTVLLCAWILWMVYPGPQYGVVRYPDRYEAWATYATLSYCEVIRDLNYKELPAGVTRLVCLPDSVNPNTK